MAKIKSYILKYDTPVNGVLYKKGCFKDINKIVSIEHNKKEVGKGKIKNDDIGIYVDGYVTDSEIKDGMQIIKNFEITGISIGKMNDLYNQEVMEYE